MRVLNLFVISFVLLSSCKNFVQNKEIKEQVVVEQPTEQPKKGVSIFLDIDFVGNINIYDKPNGKVISIVRNNVEEENFVLFDLLKKDNNMFYIVAYHSLEEDTIAEGWVFKNKHFRIYDRMYNPEKSPLILYKNPNNTSQIVSNKTYYDPVMHEVIDFSGNWLKVKTKINGIIYEGWLPPEMQCSNVYSTCN